MDNSWRSAHVAIAAGADTVINYPLWIVAKRMGAGLPAFPPLRRLYSGGGALWVSMAPTTVIEDGVTTGLRRFAESELLCAAASGVAAALLCTSQIEHVITAAHARGDGVAATARRVLRDRGAAGLLLPPGMAAMACREIPFAAALFAGRPRIAAEAERRFGPAATPGARVAKEVACGAAAAAVGGPVSHAPSVVAAYQQATNAPLAKAIGHPRGGRGARVLPGPAGADAEPRGHVRRRPLRPRPPGARVSRT